MPVHGHGVRKPPRVPWCWFDPKTVNYDLYQGVDLLTPNTKEAGEGAGLPVKGQDTVLRAGRSPVRPPGLPQPAHHHGRRRHGTFSRARTPVTHIPTFARKVFDVTGAGDTVIATVALALSAGMDMLTACTLANYAAGIVVGQVGAATATPDDMLEAIDELPEPVASRW